MELFSENGHLTDTALFALRDSKPLSDLERLEIAEHLSFCDECLMRYTALLSHLETPPCSCRTGFWRRIRLRTVRIFTSRYATAAAALLIVFSLWGFGIFGSLVERSSQLSHREVYTAQRTESWADQWSQSIQSIFEKVDVALRSFSGNGTQHQMEGIHHES